MSTRILVAEPEPHVRRILRFVLEAAGHEVRTVADGEEAWLCMAEFQPDLVLTGATLPRLDGLTLVQSMRARADLVGVPVVVLTADVQAQARARALAAGANDVLVKPFNHEELALRVANLLTATRNQRRTIGLGRKAPAPTVQVAEPVCG